MFFQADCLFVYTYLCGDANDACGIDVDWFAVLRKNALTVTAVALAAVWLLFHRPIAAWVCSDALACWLYPNSWPLLLGVTSSSAAWLVALVAAVLFALPFGRSGLLATLVGIQLAEPVLGFWQVLVLYVASSAVSIVLVHAVVQQSLMHPRAGWIHLRLAPVQSIFSPSIRRNPILWLAVGNVLSSQWYMSALGVLTSVPRERVWAALMVGNLAGFALVYSLSQVPELDAISVVLLTLVVALVLSSPVLWANLTASGASENPAKKAEKDPAPRRARSRRRRA